MIAGGLELATFPADDNASAPIYELARAGLIEAWVSPAILEASANVLANIGIRRRNVERFRRCYRVIKFSFIRHERGSCFWKPAPPEFLNVPAIGRLAKKTVRR